MLRHQLLRQARAFSRLPSPSIQIQTSHLSTVSRTSSRRIAIPASQQFFTSSPRRSQSTEATQAAAGPEAAEAVAQDKATQGTGPATAGAEAGNADANASAHKAELEKKDKEIRDLKDKYLRSVADYRNLQDRTQRDISSSKQFAIQRFATDLLDSIDNLDRALTSVPAEALGKSSPSPSQPTSNTSSADPNATPTESTSPSAPNKDLLALHNGLTMTDKIMMQTLEKHGLTRFDPLTRPEGAKFNPNTDEATFFTKVEGKSDGDVFYTQSKGYVLNGRVVRAAKVGVVKNN